MIENVETYRTLANRGVVEGLSGRGAHRTYVTYFINEKLAERLALTADDRVVDVGCGDGSFIVEKCQITAKAIGVAPTAEEVVLLNSSHIKQDENKISFIQGEVNGRIPLPDAIATKVVCNGVLLLMRDDNEFIAAVNELARLAAPGALIWIGEIPFVDELAERRAADPPSLNWSTLKYVFGH